MIELDLYEQSILNMKMRVVCPLDMAGLSLVVPDEWTPLSSSRYVLLQQEAHRQLCVARAYCTMCNFISDGGRNWCVDNLLLRALFFCVYKHFCFLHWGEMSSENENLLNLMKRLRVCYN